MNTDITIDGTTYRLAAFRSRQGWLGEWLEEGSGRSGVVSTPSGSAEEALDRAREEALAVHHRDAALAPVRTAVVP
ncbi:MAG: hypothetical protein KF833_03675 [Verrucomicrobiae bacterium]|nr:hypothetical protein [Verrucomicrobiae bacterium]